MAKKITNLKAEQKADMATTRDKWLSIGLSTETIDRDAAKAAVSKMYECSGLPAPKIFIFFDSPRQGAMAAALLKDSNFGAQVRAQVRDQVWAQVWDQVGAQVGDQVRAQVWDQVGAQVGDQVRAQVGDQVWAQVWAQVRDQVGAQVGDQVRAQVRDQVWDQVRDQVGAQVRDQVWAQVQDQVWAQVWDQVWAQVRDQVWAQVGDQVWAQVGAAIYGSHDAAWLGFYEFFRRNFGLADKASGLMAVAETCGWVWPFSGCAVITDRPCALLFDNERRLHSETGPAIDYHDGFAVHAWHGVRVPAEWIEKPGFLTAEIALGQENTALRIAAMQIVGWPKMIEQLDARVINRHPEGILGGELLAVKKAKFNPDERGEMRFLRAECPRNGLICFRVPDTTKTAHEAQAWKAGLPPSIYQLPETRT